jgi:site-specific DNA-methyltransferase (adenine-specific)
MVGDCLASLRQLPDRSINCCVTSPPYYGLRDYGVDGQIGLEETPDAYVARLVEVFREVRRALTDDGTLWLNIGDSYANNGASGPQGKSGQRADRTFTAENLGAGRKGIVPQGCKPKDLIGIPWMLAFALRADGWYLRQDIIWSKPNPMPESVRDRCTKSHEYVFLLSKNERYFYDHAAIKEPVVSAPRAREKSNGESVVDIKQRGGDTCCGVTSETRNKRSVWTVTPKPYSGAHFAVYPPELIEPCILAGCPVGGVVLDPFGGSGTTAGVALANGRNAMLCELNPEYAALVPDRVNSIIGKTLKNAA